MFMWLKLLLDQCLTISYLLQAVACLKLIHFGVSCLFCFNTSCEILKKNKGVIDIKIFMSSLSSKKDPDFNQSSHRFILIMFCLENSVTFICYNRIISSSVVSFQKSADLWIKPLSILPFVFYSFQMILLCTVMSELSIRSIRNLRFSSSE